MANLIANSYPEWSEWFTPSVDTLNEKRELGQITIPPLDDEYRMGLCSGLEIEFKGVKATDGAVFDISTYNNLDQDEVPWSKLLLNLDYAPKDGVYTFAYLFKLTDSVSTGDMINFGIETSNWKAGQYRIRHLFTSRELVYYEPPTVSDYVTSVNGQTGDVTVVAELPDHVVQTEETGVPQNVVSLKDRTTQKIVAPRTTLDAVDGQGKRGQVVGFIEDNKIGAIDDVQVDLPEHLVVAADDAEAVEDEVNINADLLEGHKAEYFAKSDQIINENLLDNGYFVGGGSQQGGGQFPINQRGKMEYTADGYSIDRWYLDGANGTMELTPSGILLKKISGADNVSISQRIPPESPIIGKYVCFSILADGKIYSITGKFPSNANEVFASGVIDGKVFISCGFNTNFCTVNIHSFVTEGITISAAKLELGDTQTLAHKAGDEWVLNEVPDYPTELAKCQRYLYSFRAPGETYCIVPGDGYAIPSFGNAFIKVPFPVAMRTKPTVSLIGSWGISVDGLDAGKYPLTDRVDVNVFDSNSIIMVVYFQDAPEIEHGRFVRLIGSAGDSNLLFDADL